MKLKNLMFFLTLLFILMSHILCNLTNTNLKSKLNNKIKNSKSAKFYSGIDDYTAHSPNDIIHTEGKKYILMSLFLLFLNSIRTVYYRRIVYKCRKG